MTRGFGSGPRAAGLFNALDAAASGDQRPFGRWMARSRGNLLSWLGTRGVSTTDAEDLAQEMFLAAWRAVRRRRRITWERAWMTVVLSHARCRQRRHRERPSDPFALRELIEQRSPTRAAPAVELALLSVILERALKSIPLPDRVISRWWLQTHASAVEMEQTLMRWSRWEGRTLTKRGARWLLQRARRRFLQVLRTGFTPRPGESGRWQTPPPPIKPGKKWKCNFREGPERPLQV